VEAREPPHSRVQIVRNSLMKQTLTLAVGVLALLFVGAQFFQPDRTNPPLEPSLTIESHLSVPAAVDSLLRKACYDCHSNETRWPWYSYVAPSSWLVARDVEQARRHLNFSEWGRYRKTKAMTTLESLCDEITARTMPLSQYALMHPSAQLTQQEIDLLCEWSESQIAAILSADNNP